MKLSFVKFNVAVQVPVAKLQPSCSAEPRVTDHAGYDITADEELRFVRIESLRSNLPNPNDQPVCVPMTNIAFFRLKDDPNTIGPELARKAEAAEKKRLEDEKKVKKDGDQK